METHQRHTQPRGVRVQHDLRGEVQDLLDRMARALVAGDGDTVASLWDPPALVISADAVMPVQSRAQVSAFFAHARDAYTTRGITNTRADLLDLERIGDRIVIATVRWPQLADDGRELGSESSDYTLRRDDDGKLRIVSVLLRSGA